MEVALSDEAAMLREMLAVADRIIAAHETAAAETEPAARGHQPQERERAELSAWQAASVDAGSPTTGDNEAIARSREEIPAICLLPPSRKQLPLHSQVTRAMRQRFAENRAFASEELAWKTCIYWRCRSRDVCTGGPRGTCRRTGGLPWCRTGYTPSPPESKEQKT